MDFLDMRTVMFSYLLLSLVCAILMLSLWRQNRGRFEGTGHWAADFVLQAAGLVLIILRGSIHDAVSMVIPNLLILTGALLGYFGLGRFTGERTAKTYNILLVGVTVIPFSYFSFIQPSTSARMLCFTGTLLIITAQCAWLGLAKVRSALRPITRPVGLVFIAYTLVSTARIGMIIIEPDISNDFFHPKSFDALFIVTYQLLFVLLTYSLSFIINKRLYLDIQTQEEKFAKAFHSSPYAVALSGFSDGRLFEVNTGFEELTGYAAAEALGKTTIELGLWADENDRATITEELSRNSRVRDIEIDFRKKSGEAVTGLLSADVIMVDGRRALLSSISDITERKRNEEKIKALLAEKELILVEVHHRVKNNLNTIYSLLNIQASSHNDPSASAVLHDAAHRVRSMMLLYDKLYRAEQVTRISTKTYLPQLVGETVAIFPGGGSVRVETDVADISIGAKTASTLGIILNELVTNAMKYAAVGRNDALLRLSLAATGGMISMVFEDDGPGMPESISIEHPTGFGMRLVDMLVRQLGGTVRIERSNGTRFIIEFRE